MLKQLDAWHKTKIGLLVFAVLELGIVYIFVSLAIDKGNLLYYLLTLVFLFGSLQNLVKFVGKLVSGK